MQGVNIMAFCKEYNAATQDKVGTVIPVEITVYEVSLVLPVPRNHLCEIAHSEGSDHQYCTCIC